MTQCDRCKFYRSNLDRAGKCYRFPPVNSCHRDYADFPQVSPDSWCGEFVAQNDNGAAKPTGFPCCDMMRGNFESGAVGKEHINEWVLDGWMINCCPWCGKELPT